MPEPATCARCGEEVRWGARNGGPECYLHRVDVDHHAILGRVSTPEDDVAREAAMDLPRIRDDGTIYTTRQYDDAKMSKAVRDARIADEEDDAEREPIPPPEVYSTRIEIGDPRLPGGAKQVLTLAAKNDWTAWATYSRGPRVHASLGTFLSMSDFVVVRLRLDGALKVAVGCWQDAKFDTGYTGLIDFESNNIIVGSANFAELKTFIKHEEDQP